jgi:AcrR family transcriptional regulator
MSSKKRQYRMTRRAELEEQTRLRITEAAVALHGSVGPARTSISALAEHAGVPRSTVYRHFPDDAALFAACSSHWRAAHPVPDLAGWAAIENADARLKQALTELYGHYRRNERMLTNILRDEASLPILTTTLAGFRQYLKRAQELLLDGRAPRPTRKHRAAVGHALAFATWRSLALEQGLTDAEVTELMTSLVTAGGR